MCVCWKLNIKNKKEFIPNWHTHKYNIFFKFYVVDVKIIKIIFKKIYIIFIFLKLFYYFNFAWFNQIINNNKGNGLEIVFQ